MSFNGHHFPSEVRVRGDVSVIRSTEAGHQVRERAGVPRQHRQAVRLRARDVGRERRHGGASLFFMIRVVTQRSISLACEPTS